MLQCVFRSARQNLFQLSVLACAVLLSGCGGGDEGPPKVPVAGTATIEGKPVSKEGLTLVFKPASSGEDQRSALIPIQPDGTFSGEVTPGTHQVYLMVSGGTSAHDDPTAAAQTFGIDPGYLEDTTAENPEPGKFHTVEIKKSEANDDLKLEFGS